MSEFSTSQNFAKDCLASEDARAQISLLEWLFTMTDMYNVAFFFMYIISLKFCLSFYLSNWKITVIALIKGIGPVFW
jgi:hypothetical protein